MQDERINVCYGISDKHGDYAKIMGTSVCSVLENTDAPVTIHILHDETMTVSNREKLEEMISWYDQQICYHDMSVKWKTTWEEIKKLTSNPLYGDFRFTMGTFYRLALGELLEGENRAIYLDADTIVNTDIRTLWEEKISVSGVAAVMDVVFSDIKYESVKRGLVDQKEYFNAGVLLIDLRKFRSMGHLTEKIMKYMSEYTLEDPDQSFLNYCFPHSATLPEKYNYFAWKGRREGKPKQGYIYHYVNQSINMDMGDCFNKLYFSYFTKTPWCDETFLGNLTRKIDEVRYEYLDFANICAGKRRIFIGLSSSRGIISERFYCREEEAYIEWDRMENFKFDFCKGKDVILLFLTGKDYADAKERFESLGIRENVHFFDMLSMLGLSNKNKLGYKLFLDC